MRLLCRHVLVALCVVALGSAAAAQRSDVEAREAALRQQFIAAYAAANGGLVTDDDAALRRYILYPYLRAARIDAALRRAEGEQACSLRSIPENRGVGARAISRSWIDRR